MALFTNQGTFTNGGNATLAGLIDLEIALVNGVWRLYSASEQNFSLGAFSISGAGALTPLDYRNYSASAGTLGVTEINITQVSGTDLLIPTGRYDNRLALHSLDGTGNFGSATGPSAAPGAVNHVASVEVGGNTYAFVSELNQSGFTTYRINPTLQVSYVASQTDTQSNHINDVTKMVTVHAHNKDFLFVASGFDAGVTAYTVDAQGTLTERQSTGPENGLGINAPDDMATLTIGNDLFMVLASTNTDSLSVFKVSTYGWLDTVDHVTDTAELYLQDVSAVETISANGRSFVLAGGGDGGLSLFELTPVSGKLSFLGSLADSQTLSLDQITDIEAQIFGGQIHLYVASNTETGISHLTLNLGTISAPIIGTKHAETLTGTANNDLILGMDRSDILYGQGGDDRLVDGSGADILNGGAGADVFKFERDDMTDFVQDFTPGTDKLDLSDFHMLYAMYQLDLIEADWGVLIKFHDERIKLMDHAGVGTLDVSDLSASDFIFD